MMWELYHRARVEAAYVGQGAEERGGGREKGDPMYNASFLQHFPCTETTQKNSYPGAPPHPVSNLARHCFLGGGGGELPISASPVPAGCRESLALHLETPHLEDPDPIKFGSVIRASQTNGVDPEAQNGTPTPPNEKSAKLISPHHIIMTFC